MLSVLSRASRNFLLRHPWQLALAVLGITLGVAVVIAIDLALESSLRTFERAAGAVSGKASHRVVAADGGLDESLYVRLRVARGVENISPVVQGVVALKTDPEKTLRLYGVDPFVEGDFRSEWRRDQDGDDGALSKLMTEANAVLLNRTTAARLRVGKGGRFAVATERGEAELTVAEISAGGRLMDDLIVADISSAQEVLELEGRLSHIDVLADGAAGKTRLEVIANSLPAEVRLIKRESEVLSMREMTRAFSINLRALGLLSLLVGMFLIYNTMTFLVVQRRPLIGSLRSLGVTRRQIFGLIVGEALALAAAGSLFGIVVGAAIGHGLLQLVSATLDAIYFRIGEARMEITAAQLVKGFAMGMGVTLLAVLAPAWEATRQPPGGAMRRSELESSVRSLVRSAGWAGLLAIAGGLGLPYVAGNGIVWGLAGIFLLQFGFGLMTPGLVLLAMKPAEAISSGLFGVIGRLPVRMVGADISRTGIAAAALMIAVSATVGTDLMIGSFRETVSRWIETSLRADLYVALPGERGGASRAAADRAIKSQIAALPGVRMLSSVLRTRLVGETGLENVTVFELNEKSKPGFIFREKSEGDVWARFEGGDALIVTEAYAYHRSVGVGGSVLLQTAAGMRPFEVVGVYADYSGDRGHLAMSRKTFGEYWRDLGYTGIGVYARSGADLVRLEEQIKERLSGSQTVRSDRAIYRASMEVFEQTFAVTETLRWLAAGIAFAGVFSALMALQFERIRQMGVLRALGVTSGQLGAMIASETGLIGLAAGIVACPVGYVVAHQLIFVIYRRAFGWTLDFYLSQGVFFQGVALAFCAALLAGVFPALKMANTRPAWAMRME